MKRRCAWTNGAAAMIRYHDEEWGVPVHDERRLFEFLILEGAQAGLSWATILRKRAAYRRGFGGVQAPPGAPVPPRPVPKPPRGEGDARHPAESEAAGGNAA